MRSNPSPRAAGELHLAAAGESPTVPIDRRAAERAATDLLEALGADLTDESLRETPRRMAVAYAELLTPHPFTATTFPNEEGYDELVVARAIPFHSLCEHHLLPFHGVAHVGYLPGERIVGLSKLGRVVELFARRLQVQERLTVQVADWLQENVRPKGVGVVIEAEHLVVGGGLAGAKAAATLREVGFDGEIVLVAEESERPYGVGERA